MIDPLVVLKFHGAAAPRYTSYPTAPHFKEEDANQLLADNLALLAHDEAVSIYIHVPFCDRLCWFCGCNTKHTLKYPPIARYVDYLEKEIRMIGEQIGKQTKVSMLHFGGGSPSMLLPAELTRIRSALDRFFNIDAETEISFEIDPSDQLDRVFEGLMEFGITRASIGVQDFNKEVQTAINRPQSFEQTQAVVNTLRDMGVKSINIDALYGLPFQNQKRLIDTLNACVSLLPDRIALFGYAHVPWVKPHQKMIDEQALPGTEERFEQATHANSFLVEKGYQAIGIDHFAKPGDKLAIAARKGALRRNFQGYTTDKSDTLLGFGASSIGSGKAGYVQNFVASGSYKAAVEKGELPVQKAYYLSREDRFRASLIERLMCDFTVDLASLISSDHSYVNAALRNAHIFAANDPFNLLTIDGHTLSIADEDRPFTRIVAMQFDQYASSASAKFSKAV